ncbi:nuclear transport factor 2 family protein [Chondromyces apiculatus]|uniref:SnoaL-like domain-containing protein n=1 Tax=Chondromyces apiculatus DSM 436 TaxID=1192034 RepID=A0A017SUA2_9BACT|nr:nuclear transport factor 2 family protein [Chondromyces apiculatus]EYF00367.1 Hypothetical protein CAP_0895 [Chondromyces apiculatus DSM 436]
MKRWLPLGLVVLGVALIAFALFGSSDKDRLLGLLHRTADAVRVEEGDTNPVVRLGRVRSDFSEIFTKEASASVPEIEARLQGREALVQAVTQLGSVYRSAHVSLGDVDLRIDPAGMTAEATATATVTGSLHGQEVRTDERKVMFTAEKVDGDWRLQSVVAGARLGDEEGGP